MDNELKPAVAEFVGTFILVFVGAGAGAVSGLLPVVALAHALALLMIVYAIGGVSGAHVNPAITLGLAVTGRVTWKRAGIFWGVQFGGAIVAALLLSIILPETVKGLGETTLQQVGPEGYKVKLAAGSGLLLEAILTTLLAFSVTVSGALGRNGSHAAIAIGFTLGACILMGGPLTGASLNPARTLGPAVIASNFADIWVYFVGPAIGGVAGAFLGSWLRGDD